MPEIHSTLRHHVTFTSLKEKNAPNILEGDSCDEFTPPSDELPPIPTGISSEKANKLKRLTELMAEMHETVFHTAEGQPVEDFSKLPPVQQQLWRRLNRLVKRAFTSVKNAPEQKNENPTE
jgi:hypothetical protein